jgi:hypothetical protein
VFQQRNSFRPADVSIFCYLDESQNPPTRRGAVEVDQADIVDAEYRFEVLLRVRHGSGARDELDVPVAQRRTGPAEAPHDEGDVGAQQAVVVV